MTGVAIEQMLELWCVELRQVKADLQSLFAHPSVGRLGGRLPRWGARARAAQDRLDAGGSRGRLGAVAPAGGARPQPLGRGCLAGHGARLCARDARLARGGAGDRRDRLSQAGPALVWRGSAVHRIGGQDHQLPDRRVCGLCVGQGLRLHRPPAVSAARTGPTSPSAGKPLMFPTASTLSPNPRSPHR